LTEDDYVFMTSRVVLWHWTETLFDESLLARVSSLSPADRLELIGVVWETLSADDLPVTDAERALFDARLADMERRPDDQSPWPEVKARLERLTR
jgi:putative addiction module component (TIGR02574 family)